MSREFLRQIIPAPHALRERWFLRPFGARLTDPRLWSWHRRAVTGAFGTGLAVCFVPLPVHLLLASAIAVVWRFNVPVACGTTLLLNPLTAVPAYYLAYRVGTTLLATPPEHFHFVASWSWLRHALFGPLWEPFVTGCLACAVVTGLLGWLSLELLWRWRVTSRYRSRHTAIAS